jgi:hypothetical protein
MCRVINDVPSSPMHALPSKYPGGGGKGVNTEPGAKGYQTMKSDKTFPDHVLPSGEEL